MEHNAEETAHPTKRLLWWPSRHESSARQRLLYICTNNLEIINFKVSSDRHLFDHNSSLLPSRTPDSRTPACVTTQNMAFSCSSSMVRHPAKTIPFRT